LPARRYVATLLTNVSYRAFIAGLAVENTVRVFKLGKKEDGVTTTCLPIEGDFPKYTRLEAISNVL